MNNLEQLILTFGPSGFEEEVFDTIFDIIKNYADEIHKDRLGNLIALKRGNGNKKLMLMAHMDQIGVMVTGIDKDGFLRFTNVGYIDPLSILYHRVVFKNGSSGIVSKEEKKEYKDLKLRDLYIDIGAVDKEDAQKSVNIGDFGVFKPEYDINGFRISTASLDDRVGCYVLTEVLKRVNNNAADLYFVFTVQEECFLSGGETSAYEIEPEAAIAVDVTDTGDTPNCSRMAVKLGGGPAVKVMDRGLISHPKIKNLIIDTAKKYGINYQMEVLEAGTTDASIVHTSRGGVMAGAVSIPARYIHTVSETVDIRDIEEAIKLVTKVSEEYK